MKIKKTKNILITGSNRSGSTWVGRVLETSNKIDNINEPLNLNRIKRYGVANYDYWYPRVDKASTFEEQKSIKSLIDHYINLNYYKVLKDINKPFEGHPPIIKASYKRIKRIYRPVKMLKDPTALFSIPWLVDEYDLNPLILVRHPAAYVLSIKDKNWWFDFDNFLNRPNFFDNGLEHLKEEVLAFKAEEINKDIVDNASLLWKIFYSQVALYQQQYPNWLYKTHEEISMNPIDEFKAIFNYFGLEFTLKTEQFIVETTKSKNHTEYKRDAKANMLKWVNNLSIDEQNRIDKITKPVREMFYPEFNIQA